MPLRTLVAALLLWMAGLMPADAAEAYWQGVAGGVSATLAEAEAASARGEVDAAKRAINEAYFRRFEDAKLEAAIRKEVSAKRAAQIERMFADMRKAVTAGDQGAAAKFATEIRQALTADAKALDAAKISPDVFAVNQ